MAVGISRDVYGEEEMNDNHAKYYDGGLSPKEEKRHWKRLELEEEAREERRAERQAELRERYWEGE